jgi:hypothetical protein
MAGAFMIGHRHAPFAQPPGWDLGLPMVYAVWIAVAIYPLCKWYAGLKRRRHEDGHDEWEVDAELALPFHRIGAAGGEDFFAALVGVFVGAKLV